MKGIFLLIVTVFLSNAAIPQVTATNFIVSDCSGMSHDLFTELDAGKVVVLVWVMPCGSCIGPALSAYSVVQKFAGSFPDRIKYYLADDLGNTSCSTLKLWAKNNQINAASYFSNAIIKMSDYGDPGMPKVVAMAGSSHEIIFNQNNSVNVTTLTSAISQRLSTGINEDPVKDFQMSIFPNPVTSEKSTLKISGIPGASLNIDIYNVEGMKVTSIITDKRLVRDSEIELDLRLFTNGLYILQLRSCDKSRMLKFIVNH